MNEQQLVNLDRVIQNVQAHPAIAILGAVLSVALWFYLGTIGKAKAGKER